ncbi:MAG: hypothetical protein ACJ0GI_04950 [Gammaproteobacteria bacterium]
MFPISIRTGLRGKIGRAVARLSHQNFKKSTDQFAEKTAMGLMLEDYARDLHGRYELKYGTGLDSRSSVSQAIIMLEQMTNIKL